MFSSGVSYVDSSATGATTTCVGSGSSNPASLCTFANTSLTPGYFTSQNTVAPLSNWDFANIWQVNYNAMPTLRWAAAATSAPVVVIAPTTIADIVNNVVSNTTVSLINALTPADQSSSPAIADQVVTGGTPPAPTSQNATVSVPKIAAASPLLSLTSTTLWTCTALLLILAGLFSVRKRRRKNQS